MNKALPEPLVPPSVPARPLASAEPIRTPPPPSTPPLPTLSRSGLILVSGG